MKSQPEGDFRRKFTGNVSTYQINKRNRPQSFLQRNLVKVLRHHRFCLATRAKSLAPRVMSEQLEMKVPNGASASRDQKPSLNGAERSFWTIKEVERCLETHSLKWHDATLSVNVKELRYKRQASLQSGQPPPKKTKLSSIPARCALTIWDSRSSKKEYVAMQTRGCTVTTLRTGTHGDTARVDMDCAFALKASELSGGLGRQDTVRSIVGSSYLMQITLYATDVLDPWPPVPLRVKPPKVSQSFDHGEIVKAPMLLGKWAKLPDCPITGTLLDVSAYQDSKSYKTKLGLEVDAKWVISPSPLMIQNLRLKKDPSPTEPRLLTPISEPDVPTPVVTVKWLFPDWPHKKDAMLVSGYLCPFCNRLNLRSMEAFHFHLITSHDNLKFLLTSEATIVARRSNIAVKVKVELADDYRERASNDVMDDREMSWERPRRSFDVDQYLKGDESWTGRPTKRQSINPAPRLNAESSSTSRERSRNGHEPLKPFNPDLVKNLPAPDRKRHVVPPAPEGITYFRSVAKRALQEGEFVSESDDEMDQSWLQQKHDETIEDFNDITGPEKEFIKVYDAHMISENLSSSLHLADALIRFCRTHKRWLTRKEMSLEFYKNATNLLLHGAIKPSVIKSCAEIIRKSNRFPGSAVYLGKSPSQSSPDAEDSEDGVPGDEMELGETDREGNSFSKQAEVPKSGQTSNQNTLVAVGASKKQGHGVCLCGEAVTDMKMSIGCIAPVRTGFCHHGGDPEILLHDANVGTRIAKTRFNI